MRKILPKNLILLAQDCPTPLYVVGGTVRDHLASLSANAHDWDICAPLSAEKLCDIALSYNFTVQAVYKNTGTVKLVDEEGVDYEFTSFRSDKYERGTHVPVQTFFTDDISLDAKRRDFTVNAIYYDVQNDVFVDPLGGILDVQAKRLRTVDSANKVFGEDGLRLMRLARQAAQLGFYPDEECLLGAQNNASLIDDISPERVWTELNYILFADKKYGVADGHYQGLKLLDKIGVLERILPELTLGKGMAQRADFHKYDVLEHSLRAVLYAPENVRLAALLHDIGKPFCTLRDGNSHAHPNEGERIAKEILTRLKAPKRTIEQVCALVKLHMYDFDCKTSENKLRKFIITHFSLLEDLFCVKQADFSACMDNVSEVPTVTKMKALLAKMQAENTPLCLKELAVSGRDILTLGFPPANISDILHNLLMHTAIFPQDNEKSRLLALAKGFNTALEKSKTTGAGTR